MLTSKPATSFSLEIRKKYIITILLKHILKPSYTNLATLSASAESLVPTWKTTFWLSALQVRKTTLPSSSSMKSTVPRISERKKNSMKSV